MSRSQRKLCTWLLIGVSVCTGCTPTQPFFLHEDGDLSHYLDVATDIEYPDVNQAPLPDTTQSAKPITLQNPTFQERWQLKLEECVAIAMKNSKNIRTLGNTRQYLQVGQISGFPSESLTVNPDFAPSIYDVAIQESGDTGVERALAAFDAQLRHTFNWDRTDRPQNVDPGGATIFGRVLDRDQMSSQTEIRKRAATGTQWAWRAINEYESSNQPLRLQTSEWTTSLEGELRHPLLRGSGVGVNRIPLLLARINTDIAIADFESNVRNMVYEVERAYWELYFQYRNLEAARVGRDSAHATWRRANALLRTGNDEGAKANEAQAAGQYYFFKQRLQTAQSQLFAVENQLRFMMGIAATDGRLIQPIDEPTSAPVTFDWYGIQTEAILRSPEIRRQKWRIKQQELQLAAAKNQLLPQFDAIARYRFLGKGDDLIDLGNRKGINFPFNGSTAWDNLTEGNFQEWGLGFEFNMNLGFRQELAQIRNQQLQLKRGQARLEDEELQIVHGISLAYRRLEDQRELAQTQYNAAASFATMVEATRTGYEVAGTGNLDLLLTAQRQRADAEVEYHRALVEYNKAITEIHWRKGSLLEYDNILLAEGPWPDKAYFDAMTLARQRDASYYMDYGFTRPGVISRGTKRPEAAAVPATDSSSAAGSPSPDEAEGDFWGSSSLDLGDDVVPGTPTPAATPQPSSAPESISLPPGEPAEATESPADAFDFGSLGL